jgi:hypothetical protein
MNGLMYEEIKNLLPTVQGDVIEFRVYKGYTFSHLVNLANKNGKRAVGIDTFSGLGKPDASIDRDNDGYMRYPQGYAMSSADIVHSAVEKLVGKGANYELHAGSLSNVFPHIKDRKFSCAILDLLQYEPTVKALEYIHGKMSVGGIIYLNNYISGIDGMSCKAINEFLEAHGEGYEILESFVHGEVPLPLMRLKKVPLVKGKKKAAKAIKKSTKAVSSTSPTIALVLRSGGDTYTQKYVNALARNIANNTTVPYRLVVLTDFTSGFDDSVVDELIPLKHKYKGWWSKVELFRPDIFGESERVVYFDLDTVIVGNIDHLLTDTSMFSGLRDLYHLTFLQTGVMVWNPKFHHQVYERFDSNPLLHIQQNYEGDAKWIRENLYDFEYLQDNYPDTIVSFKAHCRKNDKIIIPKNAAVICFHGLPRPHTITDPVITEHWKYE